MIDWKQCAEHDLREYRLQKKAIRNLREKIGQAEKALQNVHILPEGKLTATVEKERLLCCLQTTENLVASIERGLAALSPEERRVLELFFVTGDGYRRVAEEFHVESSEAYRRRDKALRNFTIAMYGVEKL